MRDNLHAEILKDPVEEQFHPMIIYFERNIQILQKYIICERLLELCLYKKHISRTACVALGKAGNRVN